MTILEPLYNRVILNRKELDATTPAGIILPDSAKIDKGFADVVAVGPGIDVNGEFHKTTVRVGDQVLFNRNGGYKISMNGREFTIINETEIFAIVKDVTDPLDID